MPRIRGYTIYNKKLINVDDNEYSQLRKLALRGGAFKTHLELSKEDKEGYKKDKIFIMRHNRSKKLVGWSLCFANPTARYGGIYLFVKPDSRRKGYGTELFDRAYSFFKRRNIKPVIYRHDVRSNRFYDVASLGRGVKIA